MPDETTVNKVVSFLAGQPFNNVIMALLLAGGGWYFWYETTKARPALVKQITDHQEAADERASDRATEGHNAFSKVADKWAHQIERLDDRHDSLVRELVQQPLVKKRTGIKIELGTETPAKIGEGEEK